MYITLPLLTSSPEWTNRTAVCCSVLHIQINIFPDIPCVCSIVWSGVLKLYLLPFLSRTELGLNLSLLALHFCLQLSSAQPDRRRRKYRWWEVKSVLRRAEFRQRRYRICVYGEREKGKLGKVDLTLLFPHIDEEIHLDVI